jgi:hypothetical protein
MIGFLNSQGFGGPNLPDVRFLFGMRENLATEIAQNWGASAITLGNDIFVRPDRWSSVTNPLAGPVYFEEVVHTMQFHVSGNADFGIMYGLAMAMGFVSSGDPHANHIEAQAIGFSRQLYDAYQARRPASRCSDR